MNREIKFRAWDNDQQCFYFFDLTEIPLIVASLGAPVMQYIGLKDRNGKEIYEGDKLSWISSNPFSLGEERTVVVSYVQDRFFCTGHISIPLAELLNEERVEIIGNIYKTQNY